jgi:hypothetical protein
VLFAVEGVLTWFRGYLRDDLLVGTLPYWNPIGGHGPGGSTLSRAVAEGGSTYITSLYVAAMRAAIRLHREAGEGGDADRWVGWADRVSGAVRERCWDSARGLFAESPGLMGQPVSQHSQVQPVLAGITTDQQARQAMDKLFSEEVTGHMLKPYGYYLARALEQTGHYERFDNWQLEDYRQMLARHLTTWQEGGEPGRSDCHAWSAWPAVDFLTAVLGIKPAKPGFEEILIRPQCIYEFARGRMPTVRGMVKVAWEKRDGGVQLKAEGPAGVPIVIELPGAEPRRFAEGGAVEARS